MRASGAVGGCAQGTERSDHIAPLATVEGAL